MRCGRPTITPTATQCGAAIAPDCMYHAEVVYRDDVAVGYVRAASYGWTLGGAVGLAYVEADVPVTPPWLADGTWEVDVAGVRYPAAVSLRPMYDPTNARVKG